MNTYQKLLFLFLLVFGSCKICVNDPNELAGNNLLKKKFNSQYENYYTKYYYDDKHLIKKTKEYRDGELVTKNEYFYDEFDKTIRVDYNRYTGDLGSSYILYEYDSNNKLIKTSAYYNKVDDTYEFRSYKLYEYDIKNQIVKALFGPEGNESTWNEYVYDQLGNLIEYKTFQQGKLSFHTFYEYDNKNNPLRMTDKRISAFILSPNNIVKLISINYMMENANYTNNYLYTYNENDYPISYTMGENSYHFEYY